MMSFFKAILVLVLHWEGIYDNDPDDKGGETVYGITRFYEPSWKGWALVDGFFPPGTRQTEAEKKWATENLPKSSALMAEVETYYLGVFNELDLGECPSERIAACIMGGWVNQGPRVEKWAQEAIAEIGVPVMVDGDLGPSSMRAMAELLKNSWGEAALLNGLMLRRAKAYSKSKPKFIAGLLARLFSGA